MKQLVLQIATWFAFGMSAGCNIGVFTGSHMFWWLPYTFALIGMACYLAGGRED